ncbi:MAG: hypothetical protein QM765_32050 [Myxococcales bacterium]
MKPADFVTFGVAATAILGLALESAALGRFRRLFADYGGTLPGPTQFVLDSRLPLVVLGVSTVLVLVAAAALRTKNYRSEGRSVLVATAALSLLTVAFNAIAAFLPLLSLGDNIK